MGLILQRRRLTSYLLVVAVLFLPAVLWIYAEAPDDKRAGAGNQATCASSLEHDGATLSPVDHEEAMPSNLVEGSRTLALDDTSCTLYLASSSIPNAGFGIYTTKFFPENSVILEVDGPSIAVTDPITDHGDLDVFDNVWWGKFGGMSDQMRYEAERKFDFQIMFGALPNFHPFLHNLDFRQTDVIFEGGLAKRGPGAGAFTYYNGKTFYATRDIQAGTEIFLDYGEHFLDDREDDFDHVARGRDYRAAGAILSELSDVLEVRNGGAPLSSQIDVILSTMMRTLGAIGDYERVLSILPRTEGDLRRVLSASNSMEAADLAQAVASEMSVIKRNVSWVRENGLCLDNIVAGVSQLPHAGRGAFAQRAIGKGEIIVPLPTLHVQNRDSFATYPTEADGDESDEGSTMQLLLNYCFGHEESSLLLCPVTNGILVNHCSSRKKQCGDLGPNARVRWATSWDPKTPVFLEKTLEDIRKVSQDRILTLELVALRDVQAGDEIFMDYGAGWEQAWDEHVAKWDGSLDGEDVTVQQMNAVERLEPVADVRADEPFSYRNLFAACWYDEDTIHVQSGKYQSDRLKLQLRRRYLEHLVQKDRDRQHSESQEIHSEGAMDDGFRLGTQWEAKFGWRNLTDKEIIKSFGLEGSRLVPQKGAYGHYWPCSVVAAEDHADQSAPTYTVRIFPSSDHDTTDWEEADVPMILTNYSRDSIQFFHQPYTSDQHRARAFRHFIEIDDEMFPDAWKDRKAD